jgi:pSer/pThr/pTyr-binding forkhead associated (FHA) protein
MLTLTVGRIGKQSRTTGTLAARELTIGRDAGSDLVLQDGLVSRTHCRLVALEGAVLVTDAGSRNGTWINGSPIQGPTLLTFHDELVIGPYTLRVQSLVGRCTTGHLQGVSESRAA